MQQLLPKNSTHLNLCIIDNLENHCMLIRSFFYSDVNMLFSPKSLQSHQLLSLGNSRPNQQTLLSSITLSVIGLAELQAQHNLFLACGSSHWNFLQFLNIKEFIFKIKTDKQVVGKCVFSSQESLLQNVRKTHRLLPYLLLCPWFTQDLHNPTELPVIAEKAERRTLQ